MQGEDDLQAMAIEYRQRKDEYNLASYQQELLLFKAILEADHEDDKEALDAMLWELRIPEARSSPLVWQRFLEELKAEVEGLNAGIDEILDLSSDKTYQG